MRSRVKIKSNGKESSSTQTLPSGIPQFWLTYFFLSIGLIGSAGGYGLSLPIYLLGRVFKPAEQLADYLLCLSIRLLMEIQPWLCGEIEIHLPSRKSGRGLLLISNHRSHLDSFILLSRVPGVRIFTKNSLFNIPFLGLMMRLTRQIPAKRGEIDSFIKGMETVRKKLKNGETVHVFPEMKRCSQGFVGTQDFSAFPFLVAIQEKAILVPIVFCGTDQVWPKGQYGLQFRYPVKIRSLDPIDSGQFTSAEALKREVRRVIHQEIV